MSSIPFCVLEKPYMIWAADVRNDNEHFLTHIDANLYYRMAHNIIGAPQPSDEPEDAASGTRSGDGDAGHADAGRAGSSNGGSSHNGPASRPAAGTLVGA